MDGDEKIGLLMPSIAWCGAVRHSCYLGSSVRSISVLSIA
jgi:hypothetical protein